MPVCQGAAFIANALTGPDGNDVLKELYIENNSIKDAGFRALGAALMKNTTLKKIGMKEQQRIPSTWHKEDKHAGTPYLAQKCTLFQPSHDSDD